MIMPGLWEGLHLHPDIERRARLIVAALAAQASAEEVTREIKKTSIYADKKLQAVKHAVAAATKEIDSLDVSDDIVVGITTPLICMAFCDDVNNDRIQAARAAASSDVWIWSPMQ